MTKQEFSRMAARYRKWLTYPSPHLLKKGCFMPSVDLIDMVGNHVYDRYKEYFGI